MTALLLDHLWQSSLCAGAAGLLALGLRAHGAHVRFWLWFAASIKFLVPFAALTALSAALLTPMVRPVTTPAITFVEPLAKPFSAPATILVAPKLPTDFSFDPAPRVALERSVQPGSSAWHARSAPPAAPVFPFDLKTTLLALWAVGFSVFTVRWLTGWLQVRRLLADAVEVHMAMPVAVPVPVKASPSRLEPGLVGIRHPVILLPAGIEGQLSPAELRAVLAHELCHWRRHDNLLAAIHMLVESLFWFFPLVWWLGARLNAEREQACDERVLAEGNDPKAYAEAILKVCRAYLQSPLACVAGVSGADLKKRIGAIVENRLIRRLNAGGKFVLSVSAATALALPLAFGLLTAPVLRLPAKAAPMPLKIATTEKNAAAAPSPGAATGLPEKQGAKNQSDAPASEDPETASARRLSSREMRAADTAAAPIAPPSLRQALAALSSIARLNRMTPPLASLAAAARPPAPARTCALPAIADRVALRKISGSDLMTVPVEINGTPKLFLLDFGAGPSEISDPAASELHLPQANQRSDAIAIAGSNGLITRAPLFDVNGADGTRDYQARVRVAAFTLGDAVIRDMRFLIANDRDMGKSEPYDGRLTGSDFPQYDVDFDFGGRTLAFLAPTDCADPDQVAYWPHQAAAAVPMTLAGGRMQVQVTIQGQTIDAVIDTGSARTVMRRDIAERILGLEAGSREMPAVDGLTDGIGMRVYAHNFAQISFPGGVAANNVPALIESNSMVHKMNRTLWLGSRAQFVSDPGDRIPGLALGMDVLHQLHLYAAFSQNKLYVTAAESTQLSAE